MKHIIRTAYIRIRKNYFTHIAIRDTLKMCSTLYAGKHFKRMIQKILARRTEGFVPEMDQPH